MLVLVPSLLLSCRDPAESDKTEPADTGCTDPSTWYADADADGFGSASTVTACAAPVGYTDTTGDCDDGNPAVSPAANEVCDGLDDDCDGAGETIETWHRDADADGYGADDDETQACDAPEGFVADATDCDDDAASIHPGADESDCTDPTDYDCDGVTAYADVDSDGWVACVECDDANRDINPDAPERCNGIDDDCDGTVDAGAADAVSWLADADGDGFGDPSVSVSACTAPDGYVADGTDCDDSDDMVHPGEVEVCDPYHVDEDCNGVADDASAEGTASWYLDADGDGHGAGAAVTACDAPAGFAPDDLDCDDADPLVNPGATESCDAADVDEDCDGLADDVDPSVTGQGAWYADADSDGYGDGSASVVACDAPSGYASIDTDCDDADADVSPSATEVCDNGVDDDCDGAIGAGCGVDGTIVLSDADAKLVGEDDYNWVGWSVSSAGDVDGDGNDDLLIGAPEACVYTFCADPGRAYVVLGPVSGTRSLSAADAVLVGESLGDEAGYAVASAGDVDGDGLDDVLVGADEEDEGGTDAGAVYIVLGAVSGTIDLSTADAKLTGESGDDEAGYSTAPAGDMEGDGFGDILVGAPGEDEGAGGAGAVYLVGGAPSGTQSLSTADAKLLGEASNDSAGYSVSSAGDIDGDGNEDVLVGAYENDAGGTDAGAAYLVLGPVSGTLSLAAADAKFVGEAIRDRAGGSVAGAGDVDGDGSDDVLIGADNEDSGGVSAGSTYLLLGPVSGTIDLSAADAKLIGEDGGNLAGRGVTSAGDVDADGNADILVGATDGSSTSPGPGAAYLLYGPVTGTIDLSFADAILVGEANGDGVGSGVAGAGDVDGDGFDDVVIGAYGEDSGATSAGAAYLLYGGGL